MCVRVLLLLLLGLKEEEEEAEEEEEEEEEEGRRRRLLVFLTFHKRRLLPALTHPQCIFQYDLTPTLNALNTGVLNRCGVDRSSGAEGAISRPHNDNSMGKKERERELEYQNEEMIPPISAIVCFIVCVCVCVCVQVCEYVSVYSFAAVLFWKKSDPSRSKHRNQI